MQIVEDCVAFLRRNGVSLSFKEIADEVLLPLQKNGQITSEPFHINRYSLAGSSSKDGSADPSDVAWRAELEKCIALGSPEARIWKMVGESGPITVEDLNVRKPTLRHINEVSHFLIQQRRLAAEPIFKGAMMEAKKNGWIEVVKDKASGTVHYFELWRTYKFTLDKAKPLYREA